MIQFYQNCNNFSQKENLIMKNETVSIEQSNKEKNVNLKMKIYSSNKSKSSNQITVHNCKISKENNNNCHCIKHSNSFNNNNKYYLKKIESTLNNIAYYESSDNNKTNNSSNKNYINNIKNKKIFSSNLRKTKTEPSLKIIYPKNKINLTKNKKINFLDRNCYPCNYMISSTTKGCHNKIPTYLAIPNKINTKLIEYIAVPIRSRSPQIILMPNNNKKLIRNRSAEDNYLKKKYNEERINVTEISTYDIKIKIVPLSEKIEPKKKFIEILDPIKTKIQNPDGSFIINIEQTILKTVIENEIIETNENTKKIRQKISKYTTVTTTKLPENNIHEIKINENDNKNFKRRKEKRQFCLFKKNNNNIENQNIFYVPNKDNKNYMMKEIIIKKKKSIDKKKNDKSNKSNGINENSNTFEINNTKNEINNKNLNLKVINTQLNLNDISNKIAGKNEISSNLNISHNENKNLDRAKSESLKLKIPLSFEESKKAKKLLSNLISNSKCSNQREKKTESIIFTNNDKKENLKNFSINNYDIACIKENSIKTSENELNNLINEFNEILYKNINKIMINKNKFLIHKEELDNKINKIALILRNMNNIDQIKSMEALEKLADTKNKKKVYQKLMNVLEYFNKMKKGKIKFLNIKDKSLLNCSNRDITKGYYDQRSKEKEIKKQRNNFI